MSNFRIGQRVYVYINGQKQKCTILSLANKNDKILIQLFDGSEMSVSSDQLSDENVL